jgi:hypothetical protein
MVAIPARFEPAIHGLEIRCDRSNNNSFVAPCCNRVAPKPQAVLLARCRRRAVWTSKSSTTAGSPTWMTSRRSAVLPLNRVTAAIWKVNYPTSTSTIVASTGAISAIFPRGALSPGAGTPACRHRPARSARQDAGTRTRRNSATERDSSKICCDCSVSEDGLWSQTKRPGPLRDRATTSWRSGKDQ